MKWLFLLLPLILLAIPVRATPTNLTYTYDINDGYVANGTYHTTYGGLVFNSDQLLIMRKMGATSDLARTYVMWDLSSISATANISSAYMFLYMSNAVGPTLNILVYNTTLAWNETNLTYNLNIAGSVLQENASVINTTNNYYKFNVTNAMQTAVSAGKNLSIMMMADADITPVGYALSRNFYSKDKSTTFRPLLEVDYTLNDIGCFSHDVNGTWCDEWNYTYWCRYDGVTNYSPCVDIYHEAIPNLFNTSQRAYTTYTAINGTDCGIAHSSCPTDTMCRQMHQNGTYSPWVGRIQCFPYDLNNSIINVDENGTMTNNTPTPQCTVYDFSNLTNQFSCFSANCHWCIASRTCVRTTSDCPTCTNTSSICYDSTCRMIECSGGSGGGGTISDLGTSLNTSLGSPYGASIIAFLTSAVISLAIFMNLKEKKIEAFIVPFFIFMAGFSMPGVNFFPMWIYLIMVTFTGVLIFWKAKG